jgi:hypothetical protein
VGVSAEIEGTDPILVKTHGLLGVGWAVLRLGEQMGFLARARIPREGEWLFRQES